MRRQARELAFQVLFQTEFAPLVPLAQILELYESQVEKDSVQYADELIQGVVKNKTQIDSKIQSASSHWKLDRMATIDRNILRIAVYEMRFAGSPLKENIVINEALEIAKKYGTSESAAFVNGLLDQIAKGA